MHIRSYMNYHRDFQGITFELCVKVSFYSSSLAKYTGKCEILEVVTRSKLECSSSFSKTNSYVVKVKQAAHKLLRFDIYIIQIYSLRSGQLGYCWN